MFSNLPLKDFIKELSSSNPTPGGGTASNIVAAFGFSLVAMVMGIANKKKQDEALTNLIERANNYANFFLELSSKDAEAFDKVMDAFKLPKNTDEEKKERAKIIQAALKEASIVPMELIKKIVEGFDVVQEAFSFCPDSAISDLYTAISFLEAAFDGGVANVIINLKSIKDEAFVTQQKELLQSLTNDFKNRYVELKEKIFIRLNS